MTDINPKFAKFLKKNRKFAIFLPKVDRTLAYFLDKTDKKK